MRGAIRLINNEFRCRNRSLYTSDNPFYDLLYRHGYIERQRVRWFFERLELALKHLRLHIMVVALGNARPDQIVAALKVNELHLFIAFKQLLAIAFLECRAG